MFILSLSFFNTLSRLRQYRAKASTTFLSLHGGYMKTLLNLVKCSSICLWLRRACNLCYCQPTHALRFHTSLYINTFSHILTDPFSHCLTHLTFSCVILSRAFIHCHTGVNIAHPLRSDKASVSSRQASTLSSLELSL